MKETKEGIFASRSMHYPRITPKLLDYEYFPNLVKVPGISISTLDKNNDHNDNYRTILPYKISYDTCYPFQQLLHLKTNDSSFVPVPPLYPSDILFYLSYTRNLSPSRFKCRVEYTKE